MWNVPVIGGAAAGLEGRMTPFRSEVTGSAGKRRRDRWRPEVQLQQSRPVNLVSVLLRHAQERPDAVALVDEAGAPTTFAELEGAAAATAGSFRALGVTPGDRVAIAAWNDAGFVRAYLGALWAGAVAVPMNPSSPAAAHDVELRRVGARVLVCGVGAEHLLGLPGAIATAELPAVAPMGAEVERDDADLAVLLFTSGTAGAPRAAMLTHGNLAANIGQVQSHPGLRVAAPDVGLATLPFFHVFGLNVALGVALAGGVRSVLLPQFDPSRAVELVRAHGVTILAGVPAMFAALLELSDTDAPASTFASVRLAVAGAAELPEPVAAAFHDRFGVTIYEGYGLTEAAPIVSTTAVDRRPRRGSIGPPLPGVEVRLVDADGTDVAVGDPGEIWVRGPNVFTGYWDDPEATGRVLHDGWLRTGDVAVSDDEGFLSLVDRMKDLVIVSGFNVYPAEVEDALRTHPDVADAAVVGAPNARTGEAVVAFVVPRPGGPVPTLASVRDHVARRLARYKVPTAMHTVPELPRNQSGKVLRRHLVPPTDD
jgi:long-chain acyl-CoA synthetase